MASSWYSIVVDSADIKGQSAFWAEVLGYDVAFEADVLLQTTIKQGGTRIPDFSQSSNVFA